MQNTRLQWKLCAVDCKWSGWHQCSVSGSFVNWCFIKGLARGQLGLHMFNPHLQTAVEPTNQCDNIKVRITHFQPMTLYERKLEAGIQKPIFPRKIQAPSNQTTEIPLLSGQRVFFKICLCLLQVVCVSLKFQFSAPSPPPCVPRPALHARSPPSPQNCLLPIKLFSNLTGALFAKKR